MAVNTGEALLASQLLTSCCVEHATDCDRFVVQGVRIPGLNFLLWIITVPDFLV